MDETNANIAQDQELEVLPENEREEEKIVEVDATTKSLPRATTTATPIGKRKQQPPSLQKQQQQKKK